MDSVPNAWKVAGGFASAGFVALLAVLTWLANAIDRYDERLRIVETTQAERNEFVRSQREAQAAFAFTAAKVIRVEGMIEGLLRSKDIPVPPNVTVEDAIRAAEEVEAAVKKEQDRAEEFGNPATNRARGLK